MIKAISAILFVLLLFGDNFTQNKSFGYKISGNGDIVSDVFIIKNGFVLDSAVSIILTSKKTFGFEYDENGKLKRDINFIPIPSYDSSFGTIYKTGYRDYFYNERGDVDSVSQGVWNGTKPEPPSGGYSISYTYDNEGNILSKINSSGGFIYRIEENNYDSSGNLIFNKINLTAYNDSTITIREYDTQNRLIKLINKKYRYNYDQVLYQYDISGNIQCTYQQVDTINDTIVFNSTHYFLEFDQSGKLVHQTKSRMFNPADSTWERPYEIFCDYDEYGKILKMGTPAWFHYNVDGNLDTAINVQPESSGYLGAKGTLIDSYGNIITFPTRYSFDGTMVFYYHKFIPDGVVPVELTSFTINAVDNKITLRWETTTEKNNRGFDIERSSDNKTFTKIGHVQGKGTTSEKQSYSFIDQSTAGGKYFYRLKQVDFDGHYVYSEVVEISAIPMVYDLAQNYPNPFNPETTIKFQIPNEERVILEIYNSLGEKVKTLVDGIRQPGFYELKWDGTNNNNAALSSGLYIYRISAGKYVVSKKMMLLK